MTTDRYLTRGGIGVRRTIEQQQAMVQERLAWQVEQEKSLEAQTQAQAEFEELRGKAREMLQLLPELEARGEASLERLVRGRER